MAHGLVAIKEMRLDAYAKRFAEAGYSVLVFDYRHFGESGGQPRQLLDINKQHQDWRAAIQFAQSNLDIGIDKIVLWGSSLSGGHVIQLASEHPGLAGVISQVPHMDGKAGVFAVGLGHVLKLTLAGLRDSLHQLLGLQPYYINASGKAGELAIMTKPEAVGYLPLAPASAQFDQRLAARFVLTASSYSPGKYLKKLSIPVLLQVAMNDKTTPPEPAIKACKGNPAVKLVTYNLGHFEPYVEPAFSSVVAEQLTFLKTLFK
jgi:pimeloyl-ACP methyl ester carboxylesterase